MSLPLIPRPSRPSEFEMQADLYLALKRAGYEVRGEVPSRFEGKKCIFDLVIYRGEHAAIIIEVKNSPHLGVLNGHKTKQNVAYAVYGIPLVYFTTATPMESIMEKIRKLMEY